MMSTHHHMTLTKSWLTIHAIEHSKVDSIDMQRGEGTCKIMPIHPEPFPSFRSQLFNARTEEFLVFGLLLPINWYPSSEEVYAQFSANND